MVPEEQPDELAAALDADEDLFDFPSVNASYDPLALDDELSSEKAQGEPPAVEVKPVAGETAPEEPAQEPQPVSADGSHFADLEIDDDIFDFDAVFLAASPGGPAADNDFDEPAAESIAESGAPAARVEAAADAPAAAPSVAPAKAAPRDVAPKYEHPRLSRPLTTAQAPGSTPGFDPAAPPVFPPDLAVSGKRNHLVEILAVAFLVLNTSLILFAWRAGDDFRETLLQVTSAVTDAVSQGQAQAGPAQPVVVEVPVRAPVEPAVELDQDPSPAVPLERTVLDIAQGRLDAGKFEEARRGLFQMLAGQDRSALPVEVVAEAELLIARSYYLQGKATRGTN